MALIRMCGVVKRWSRGGKVYNEWEPGEEMMQQHPGNRYIYNALYQVCGYSTIHVHVHIISIMPYVSMPIVHAL